jgi:hypothetical protein
MGLLKLDLLGLEVHKSTKHVSRETYFVLLDDQAVMEQTVGLLAGSDIGFRDFLIWPRWNNQDAGFER